MEPLIDPTQDRVIKDISPPPHKPLSDELLYPAKSNLNPTKYSNYNLANSPSWEVLKNHLYREGRITKEHCKKVLRDTLAMISKQAIFN